jgi:hypothetical protein
MKKPIVKNKITNQEDRKHFWCNIILAYTSSSNSTDLNTGIKWANEILEAYDKKFKI